MFTNELKKGDKVRLGNGWDAIIWDNKKGDIRMAEVHGFFTEIGSVYSHDIIAKYTDSGLVPIEHTKSQLKLRDRIVEFG
jgi:transposase